MKFDALFTYCPVCGSTEFNQHNIKSKRCGKCGFVMYINPSAAVAAFITNAKGEVLICIRGKEPAKGTWDLPGGFVDDHETAEQALKRELKEELGMKVDAATYLFSLPNEYQYSGWTLPTLDLFFHWEIKDDQLPVPADDVVECFFMPLHQINKEKFGLRSMQKAIEVFKSKKTDAKK